MDSSPAIHTFSIDSMANPTFPTNTPPVAHDDRSTTTRDMPIVIDVLQNDTDANTGDILSITGITSIQNGTVAITSQNTIRFTPSALYCGTGSFSYGAQDRAGALSNIAIVTISILCDSTPSTPNPGDTTSSTPSKTVNQGG